MCGGRVELMLRILLQILTAHQFFIRFLNPGFKFKSCREHSHTCSRPSRPARVTTTTVAKRSMAPSNQRLRSGIHRSVQYQAGVRRRKSLMNLARRLMSIHLLASAPPRCGPCARAHAPRVRTRLFLKALSSRLLIALLCAASAFLIPTHSAGEGIHDWPKSAADGAGVLFYYFMLSYD